ncbi:hypothetical protein [Actinokineospora bangkokensis]|uniref:Uncharacterized protein n=1 Tax=Actinokineospora bangkokensis TaxID=1193682 RepID=A0A1Q9LBV3_9PSEU|nr:hypothetical protein [Actinokineospora bangkokensis]OLR89500.1 hypothetical protein BJP25_05295 [Actinokineospora bangkokensis]
MNEDEELAVPAEIHTVCQCCGGGGMVADPKLAVIVGEPRPLDNGRPCPHCDTTGQFAGIIPPL